MPDLREGPLILDKKESQKEEIASRAIKIKLPPPSLSSRSKLASAVITVFHSRPRARGWYHALVVAFSLSIERLHSQKCSSFSYPTCIKKVFVPWGGGARARV